MEQTNESRVIIICPYEAVSGSGKNFLFNPYRQYCYKDKTFVGGSDKYNYTIEIEDEDYIVPGIYLHETTICLNEEEQKSIYEVALERLHNKVVKDHKKRTLEVLGIDIKANERTDF